MSDHNVHCAWEAFVESGIGSAHVRNTVLNSWQRSRQHRVCVDLQVAQTLSESELHRKRQQGRHLLKASRQALEQAQQLLAGSDLMMMLTDTDGIVLDTAGDTQTVARGHDIGLQRGGIWDETVIGTNAIGTALVTGAPVQIHASEHFCSSVQHWTCAAAPIHHPLSRKVLGVVDLSGWQHTFSPQNLAHAVALDRPATTWPAWRSAARALAPSQHRACHHHPPTCRQRRLCQYHRQKLLHAQDLHHRAAHGR